MSSAVVKEFDFECWACVLQLWTIDRLSPNNFAQ